MEARKRVVPEAPPFQLSLRIRHPSMDPAAISRELHLEAEHSFRAGEPRHSRSGYAPGAVHAESYWLAALNASSWLQDIAFSARPGLEVAQQHMAGAAAQSLEWSLMLCAMRLGKSHGALLQKIRADGGQVSLLVVFSPSVTSFSVPPEVSRILGEAGVTTEFEVTAD
jgi:hypothetical protein